MTSRSIGLSILAILIVAAAAWAIYSNNDAIEAEMATSTALVSVPAATSTSTVSDSQSPTPAPANPTYTTGETVTITARIGQTVHALGESITPTAIVDDSRCPSDVQCIWAGTVHVKATIDGGMGKSTVTFELGKESTTETNSIVLESVSPAKNSKQEIAAGDYVLTFKVTRR